MAPINIGFNLSPQLLSSLYQRALIMIYIWINTYNRPEELNALLNNIKKNIGTIDYFIRVYDDGSTEDYEKYIDRWTETLNFKYTKVSNHGKKLYWSLLNIGMREIKKKHRYDYYLRLDDDVILVDGFFDKIINIWEGISDPNKISLFPLLDSREGQKVWTDHEPILIKREKVYNCGWVDDMYFCTYRFFEELDFNIPKIPMSRWKNNPNLSTGTGRYISRTFHKKELGMYLVTKTLLLHHERTKEHPSVMNPKDY